MRPKNLVAFLLVIINVFLPGLPTLRANKMSNDQERMSTTDYVRLLEIRQNRTNQQLKLLVEKIALLEVCNN